MNVKKTELIRLIHHALEISEQMKGNDSDEQLDNLISVLKSTESRLIEGKLEQSQGVLNLGLSRGVADWIDSLDSPLLRAVGEIEKYYQRHYDY